MCVIVCVYVYEYTHIQFKWGYTTADGNAPLDHTAHLSQMRVVNKGQGYAESLPHSLSASKTFLNSIYLNTIARLWRKEKQNKKQISTSFLAFRLIGPSFPFSQI